MKKELPKIYSEVVDHDTNTSVAYTKSDELRSEKETVPGKSVDQKIREIFNSVNYVYKIQVVIETGEGSNVKQLVGRNRDYLITMDNEQIPISSIKDIYIK